ncbi:GNAT family N-acetyltransferase [Xenorhabdus lircayensis]|uniref:GNAT family N-acetyltransferase n=1 Tax=Xenorhabdus lircayensis TaxID=2763499 RepID=A0ABS0U7V7_9GAMM|nr:GNAT family N-acetyltransferase [Xenorhabdus lircayensis]MBI6549712.1 GNAT family N-acetyltransferase [Xenorhabdus lircayensis]
MLKRTYSYNGRISDISFNRLSRVGSNRTISSIELLNTEFSYNNPALFNSYMPVVNEVSKQEMERANNKILFSLSNDKWFFDVPRRNVIETEQEKKEKKQMEAWHERCLSTKNNLEYMKSHLEWMTNSKSYFHFVCYINSQPIGVIMLKYSSDNRFCEPEVSYLITHLGIQNSAYLLMEKAVNKSYQLGVLGNLTVNVANDFLREKVYSRLGFISVGTEEMHLRPFERKQWIFYPHQREFRFLGNH